MQISLSQTIGIRELDDFEILPKLYAAARRKRKIITAELGGQRFQYALINPTDFRKGTVLRGFIERQESDGRGLYGQSFVFDHLTPPEFRDYTGLHESVEVSLGPGTLGSHGTACQKELEEILKGNSEFVQRYVEWRVGKYTQVDDPGLGYFGPAIFGFVQTAQRKKLSPLETILEFKQQLDAGCHLEEHSELGYGLIQRKISATEYGVFDENFDLVMKTTTTVGSGISLYRLLLTENKYDEARQIMDRAKAVEVHKEKQMSDRLQIFHESDQKHYLALLNQERTSEARKFKAAFDVSDYANDIYYEELIFEERFDEAEQFSREFTVRFQGAHLRNYKDYLENRKREVPEQLKLLLESADQRDYPC